MSQGSKELRTHTLGCHKCTRGTQAALVEVLGPGLGSWDGPVRLSVASGKTL